MVAVPSSEVPPRRPLVPEVTGAPEAPPRHRRAVAVAVTAMELLRPASDLARLLEGFTSTDVLLASEDASNGPGSVLVLDPDEADRYDDGDDGGPDDLHARAAELGIPDLHLHRLGYDPPQVGSAETDVVAALSELVGFDPEPGVYCLAPADVGGDAGRAAVGRAAQRIAQVYGIPLLRYRCLELSLVEPA